MTEPLDIKATIQRLNDDHESRKAGGIDYATWDVSEHLAIIAQLWEEHEKQQAQIDKLVGALEFYRNVESYMASLKTDKRFGMTRPAFDFRNTPVHADGGNKARTALALVRCGKVSE